MAQESGGVAPAASPGGRTVVVVQDDPVVQMLLCRQLEELGWYAVVVASDGPLATALQPGPALVIVDAAMPAQDRDAVMAVLDAHEVPAVCLTPDDGPLVPGPDQCRAVVGSLPRPPRRDQLMAVLSTHARSSAPSGTTDVHVDRAALEELQQQVGDPVVVGRIVDAFLDSVADRRAELETAQAAGDLLGVERVAHSLKSAAALVGLSELSAAARHLEAAPDSRPHAASVQRLLAVGEAPLRALRNAELPPA